MRYKPVAVDTFGETPIYKSIGLNITPPPRPRAPATIPPNNPKSTTFNYVLLSKIKSLLQIFIPPYFRFKSYSFYTNLTPKNMLNIIKAK